ncbi:hypothetical protein [Halosimplex rubrum]|nr:hypothetical protein [Halosimplex rubrum]
MSGARNPAKPGEDIRTGKRWSQYDLEVPVAASEFELDALRSD